MRKLGGDCSYKYAYQVLIRGKKGKEYFVVWCNEHRISGVGTKMIEIEGPGDKEVKLHLLTPILDILAAASAGEASMVSAYEAAPD